MGLNVGEKSSEIIVIRDEQDKYYTYLKYNYFNSNNEEKTGFQKMRVNFKKGVDILNKTKIRIKEGWIIPYRIEMETEGKKQGRILTKVFINEFEILENGIQEKQKVTSFEAKKVFTNKEEKMALKNNEELNTFGFDSTYVSPI